VLAFIRFKIAKPKQTIMKKKYILAAFALGLSISAKVMAQVPSYVPTNGLVGWWPFNGNANDESGNVYNGSQTGTSLATLTLDRFGNLNSAYYLNSNSQISTTYSGLLGGNSRSANFWMKTTSTTSQYIVPLFWGSMTSQVAGGRFACSFNYPNPGVTIDIAESAITYAANTPVNDNNWHMYTLVFDNTLGNRTSTVKVFQDGILLTSIVYSYNPNMIIQTVNEEPVSFRGNNNFMDDISIFDRPLNQQEITTLYNACTTNEITTQPINSVNTIGANAQFFVNAASGSTFQWQSNPLNVSWQNVPSNANYSGSATNTLTVSNTSVSNHHQPFRAIINTGGCTDTSNVATIQIVDTCITNVTVYDTLYTTVTDTLIINTTLGLPAPNNENMILIYPNPASNHITIDNGNYTAMSGYTIKIENNAGQQVFQSLINQGQFYVDLSTWSGNGLYFVHIFDAQGNTVTVRKIVLQ